MNTHQCGGRVTSSSPIGTMARSRDVTFGYNAPAGDRGVERINPQTFLADFAAATDLAASHLDALWVPDHLMRDGGFRLECWTLMTWLAARHASVQLGTIVMANAFRHPPLLAKMVATLQNLSQGRIVVGYGAGWLKSEYQGYGYEFAEPRERIARMVEAVRLMRTLWTESPATFEGDHWTIQNAYCHPQPRPVPPVMIGGDGERYLLRAVAEHADWWMAISRGLSIVQQRIDLLARHCQDVGRDPTSIVRAYPLTVYLANTRAKAKAASVAHRGDEAPFVGEPGDLAETLHSLVNLGFSQFSLIFARFPKLDDIELFVDRVLPEFQA